MKLWDVAQARLSNQLLSKEKGKGPGDVAWLGAVQAQDFAAAKRALGLCTHNVTTIAEIIIAKHRNGPIAQVELFFHKEHSRFANLGRRA